MRRCNKCNKLADIRVHHGTQRNRGTLEKVIQLWLDHIKTGGGDSNIGVYYRVNNLIRKNWKNIGPEKVKKLTDNMSRFIKSHLSLLTEPIYSPLAEPIHSPLAEPIHSPPTEAHLYDSEVTSSERVGNRSGGCTSAAENFFNENMSRIMSDRETLTNYQIRAIEKMKTKKRVHSDFKLIMDSLK